MRRKERINEKWKSKDTEKQVNQFREVMCNTRNKVNKVVLYWGIVINK